MPSATFTAQAGWQKWAVPNNVTRVSLDLHGSGSGATPGGRVRGDLRVKETDVLYLLVGEAGKAYHGSQGGAGAHGGGGQGGDASPLGNGGYGGGGAAAVRLNSSDGTIKAVAGGAGGGSGDSGAGGEGGGDQGGHGSLGNSGSSGTGNATGGSQYQGGNGGASNTPALSGADAANTALATGGAGGQRTSRSTHGGGGGGGGYRAGGGGAASLISVSPGGGGGGGSSFTGGLFTSVSNDQGGGGTGDATIIITWDAPPPANQPPGVPSDAKVDGRAEASGMSTRSTGRVRVSAVVRDNSSTTVAPTHIGGPSTQVHQHVRLLVRYSAHVSFANPTTIRSDLVANGDRAEVVINGLHQATHYYLHLYAEDAAGKLSDHYNSVDFWTNRPPAAPTLTSPGDNVVVLTTDTVTLDWTHIDPDDNDRQSAFEARWRRASTTDRGVGKWVTTTLKVPDSAYEIDPGYFKAGNHYDWTVRTRDQQGVWGPFAVHRKFYVLGTVSPPRLDYPTGGQAVDVSGPVLLNWTFRDPTSGQSQTRADIRYRVVGSQDWVTRFGDTTTPGATSSWTFPVDTFAPRQHYEWSARTYNGAVAVSDWQDPQTFWTHGAIGQLGPMATETFEAQGLLGTGRNRVFVYDRGGTTLRGEITPLVSVEWGRSRDDMDNCVVTTNGFGADVGSVLAATHTWLNELVVFREVDGKLTRVWEGPITLITDSPAGFSIEAKDVMGYVYRRIMRTGYNDSYRLVQGIAEGLMTVVERASLIIRDALARNDPNVLAYLTEIRYSDDAREARVVPDFTKTAWEEVDDMAANAGLDYSVIGRRIILNDTSRPIGRLPELRNQHFSSPPVISEYGMQLTDYYAVTDGTGLWGAVEIADSPYGGVEILTSSFTNTTAAPGQVLTAAKSEQIRRSLVAQAHRGIASRYPVPVIVRVPDSSRLLADTPVDINQLVPGVWVPIRAQGTLLSLAQWQKLDSMRVVEAAGDEQVSVTFSPAPNAGQDPDADGGVTALDAT